METRLTVGAEWRGSDEETVVEHGEDTVVLVARTVVTTEVRTPVTVLGHSHVGPGPPPTLPRESQRVRGRRRGRLRSCTPTNYPSALCSCPTTPSVRPPDPPPQPRGPFPHFRRPTPPTPGSQDRGRGTDRHRSCTTSFNRRCSRRSRTPSRSAA